MPQTPPPATQPSPASRPHDQPPLPLPSSAPPPMPSSSVEGDDVPGLPSTMSVPSRSADAAHDAASAACEHTREELSKQAQRRSLEDGRRPLSLGAHGEAERPRAVQRRGASSVSTSSMILCVALAAAAPASPVSGTRLTSALRTALITQLNVAPRQIIEMPYDGARHSIVLELFPPDAATARSAQTIAVQATSELARGPSTALLAHEPLLRFIDGRTSAVATLGVSHAPAPSRNGRPPESNIDLLASQISGHAGFAAVAVALAWGSLFFGCLCWRRWQPRAHAWPREGLHAAELPQDVEKLARMRRKYQEHCTQAESQTLIQAAAACPDAAPSVCPA